MTARKDRERPEPRSRDGDPPAFDGVPLAELARLPVGAPARARLLESMAVDPNDDGYEIGEVPDAL